MNFGKVLERQLSKRELSFDELPQNKEEWQTFLKSVNSTYEELETQRKLQENLVDVSTKEMERLYKALEEKTQNELERQEEKLLKVINAVPSIVAWVDLDGKILGFNEQIALIFNSNRDNLFGKSFLQLGWQEVHDCILNLYKSSLTELSLDLELKSKDPHFYYKINFRKFSNDENIALVGIDLTKEIQKQQELEASRATAVSSSRLAVLGEMAAGIAHEINNPLAVIHSLAAQVVKKVEMSQYDDIQQKMEKIRTTVLRITKIISGLRTFARDGEHDPFVPVLLQSIIDDTLELSSERLKSLGIPITVNNLYNNLEIDCRATQISQVLLNLVSNARDAIREHEERWIRIDIKDEGTFIEMRVVDSGKGIPNAIREKIFQPFYTTKEVGVGTGLGLSISIGIIKAHRGRMYIDEKAPNTTFVCVFPKKYSEELSVSA